MAALLVLELPDAGAGVEQRTTDSRAEIVFWVEASAGEAALSRTRQIVRELAERGQPLDHTRVELRPAVPESEWRDAWKRYFKTIRLTRQIVVVPSWDSHTPGQDDRIIHLDPGQAFGTGAHASTCLCLELMQRLADGGATFDRMLDVGTGSGILSLAAARLWPGLSALAIDNDPLAVQATCENAERNQLAARVEASGHDLTSIAERFPLVAANIQAEVLIELADPLHGRVAGDGHLILSGILSELAQGVADAFISRGMVLATMLPSEQDPAWTALHLTRPS